MLKPGGTSQHQQASELLCRQSEMAQPIAAVAQPIAAVLPTAVVFVACSEQRPDMRGCPSYGRPADLSRCTKCGGLAQSRARWPSIPQVKHSRLRSMEDVQLFFVCPG